MQPSTIHRLSQLNQDFYAITSQHFSETRVKPWDGWQRVLPHLEPAQPLKVLDIGCGNGRLLKFLDQVLPQTSIKYVGIDSDPDLLAEVGRGVTASDIRSITTYNIDLIAHLLEEKNHTFINESDFDLVFCAGVMHHIPSFELRKKFLNAITNHLAAEGIGCISFWQFDHLDNIIQRAIDPTQLGIQSSELEANDYILDWQRGIRAYRYCHLITQEEQDQLTPASITVLDRFAADGKDGATNDYWIFTPKRQ